MADRLGTASKIYIGLVTLVVLTVGVIVVLWIMALVRSAEVPTTAQAIDDEVECTYFSHPNLQTEVREEGPNWWTTLRGAELPSEGMADDYILGSEVKEKRQVVCVEEPRYPEYKRPEETR